MSDAELLDMQAPAGLPRSNFFEVVTDPLIPSVRTSEMLAHFWDETYDLSPESHISRLLKVLLGDTGTSQLRKRYTYAHLSHFLLTTHFYDLDKLYADVFGVRRFVREQLDINPYLDATTDEEWQAIDIADASYRSRISAFGRALQIGGTVDCMLVAASAVLGSDCRIYESYAFLDDSGQDYAPTQVTTPNTWGDLETNRYLDLSQRSYGELEGQAHYQVRDPGSRSEFIVRPVRTISHEERLHLTRALSRLKPAESLLTIDDRPAALNTPVTAARAAASSSYWHVQSLVQPQPEMAAYYDLYSPDEPLQQPRPAFSAYQGEAWSYNGDVISVSSSAEDEEGNVVQDVNYERTIDAAGNVYDYTPDLALTDAGSLLRGRYVSDGVMAASPVVRGTL